MTLRRPMRVLGLLLLSMAAWPAVAQTCSVSASPIAFGTYNPQAGAPNDSSGQVSVTCQAFLSLLLSYEIRLSAGNSGNFGARQMSAAGATLQFGGGGLHGQLPAVSDAATAERLLIPVGDDMLVVGLRDAEVSLTVLPGLDLAHGVAALQFDGAAAERLPGAAPRLLAIAATFAAFVQLDGAQR